MKEGVGVQLRDIIRPRTTRGLDFVNENRVPQIRSIPTSLKDNQTVRRCARFSQLWGASSD